MPDAWNSLLSETFPLSPPPRTKSLFLCRGIPPKPPSDRLTGVGKGAQVLGASGMPDTFRDSLVVQDKA